MNLIEDKEDNHICFYYIILAQDFMQKDIQYAPHEMDYIQNHILNLKFSYIKSQ